MCGICGAVAPSLPEALPLAALRHRGPDAEASWTDGRTCALGHTRLSIIDLSERAAQPMLDPSGRFVLVFNGEIYNYPELRRDHLADEVFHSDADTEVLLLLWKRYGPACLRHLRGMFAFALWDAEEERLWLARDRVGKKPLVYAQMQGGFYFASELPALRRVLPAPPALDPAAIDLFLAFQAIPAPHTIYRGVRKLLPGHCASWQKGRFETSSYWRLDFSAESALRDEEALERFEAELRTAVSLRLRADVPVGVLLSGGIDSGLVTAFASESASKPLQTFTVGFRDEAFNELESARAVAERYGTAHHPILLDADAEEMLDLAIDHYGEPFADKSALPSLFVCREAARHVKVVLNGDGGDELTAGYPKYNAPLLKRLFAPLPFAWCQSAGPLRRWCGRRLSPWAPLFHIAPFVTADLREEIYQPDFRSATEHTRTEYLDSLAASLPSARDLLSRLLQADANFYLANDLLVKMDIASMAFSLEARSPLLDYRLIELAASLPSRLKRRGGTGKILLKRLAEKYLPAGHLALPKRGFAIPGGDWIRSKFSGRLDALLRDPAQPVWQYLTPTTARAWFEAHMAKRADHASRLWAILVLGLWMDRHA